MKYFSIYREIHEKANFMWKKQFLDGKRSFWLQNIQISIGWPHSTTKNLNLRSNKKKNNNNCQYSLLAAGCNLIFLLARPSSRSASVIFRLRVMFGARISTSDLEFGDNSIGSMVIADDDCISTSMREKLLSCNINGMVLPLCWLQLSCFDESVSLVLSSINRRMKVDVVLVSVWFSSVIRRKISEWAACISLMGEIRRFFSESARNSRSLSVNLW